MIKIIAIHQKSPHLDKVKELWRRNSKTLGFFPEGAFDYHANKNWILVAESPNGDFLGYLLYRIVRRGNVWPHVVIVHLCINEELRSKGVARKLVEYLRDISKKNHLRIELNCRRDYDLTKFWSKLNFIYSGEMIGRSGFPVTHWEMTLIQPPLIELMDRVESQSKLRAVIDANVIFRLQDEIPESPSDAKSLSIEAKALEAEWISQDIIIMVTNESSNEIERHNDSYERSRRLTFIQKYPHATCEQGDFDIIHAKLDRFFPQNHDINTESDIRQLAYAIAAKTDCFITQDNELIKLSDQIYSEFGVYVLSPGEFINRVDENIRDTEYRPQPIVGIRKFSTMRLQGNDLPSLFDIFGLPGGKEKRVHFERLIRTFMAKPDCFQIQLYNGSDQGLLALTVYDKSTKNELIIHMFRIARSFLGPTILRHLLHEAILMSYDEKRTFVRIIKDNLGDNFEQALRESGFIEMDKYWVKCNFPFIGNIDDLYQKINELKSNFMQLSPFFDHLLKMILNAKNYKDTVLTVNIERLLWPTKILNSGIENFIIPIKPIWAQHLFDTQMADQTLWGARDDLALRYENVYYRSNHSAWKITSPARIMWYITYNRSYIDTMSVRACSLLDEVAIGIVKDLYKRFQRLGIYEWRDVLKTAKNDPYGQIMALRFSNTEILPKPIHLSDLRELFNKIEGSQPFLQSPQPISDQLFAKIYHLSNDSMGGNS